MFVFLVKEKMIDRRKAQEADYQKVEGFYEHQVMAMKRFGNNGWYLLSKVGLVGCLFSKFLSHRL